MRIPSVTTILISMGKFEISLVIPCYNEEETVGIFYRAVEEVRAQMGVRFEYLFVDDGSLDATLDVVKELAASDGSVHYLSFSRNFGKEAAIYAGLKKAKGKYTAVMDADLQDPPELLPEMYRLIEEEGYDCVGARRVNRAGEPVIRSALSRCFYRVIDKMSRTQIVDGARDFQLMNRKVREGILKMKEYNRFYKGLSNWVGYRKIWLTFTNRERIAGETKWSLGKLFLYALDGMMSFSTTPLVISSVIGSVFCVVAFVLILVIIVKTLIFGDPTSGWPSLVCLIMMVSGVQLLCIGILGQYQAKTYLETKRRPIYLIREKQTGKKKRSEKDL